MRMRLYTLVFFACTVSCTLAQSVDVDEIRALRATFSATVSALTVEDHYAQSICRDVFLQLSSSVASGTGAVASQYFVYVDRNPDQQLLLVGCLDVPQGVVYEIGWDHVSTGNPKRSGHFVTPTGVFANSTENVGYRALGTKNSRGWRGLGGKGSRVWDFGWQWTDYSYSDQSEQRQIRLLLHATDPHFGESRLGKTDSKGCVRISAKLNQFLDHYGILDCDYEREQKRFSWLLKPLRQPVHTAGRYLVVGDSQDFSEPLRIVKTP